MFEDLTSRTDACTPPEAESRSALQDDVLTALCIKGGVSDYEYYLTRPNVVIEGSDQVNGRDVLVLKIDLTTDLSTP